MDEQHRETELGGIDLTKRVRAVLGLISGFLFIGAAIWLRNPFTALRLVLVAVAVLVIGVTLPRST